MKSNKYMAREPDANGMIAYTSEEDAIWHELYQRQMPVVNARACSEFLTCLTAINLPQNCVPQCKEVSDTLTKATAWKVKPVAALITFDEFFDMLAQRIFPAASFVRTHKDMDYLMEPDIFHEIYGHCPLIMDQRYANFLEEYGKIANAATHEERVLLARLFWFTIEFGLIHNSEGLRVYGAGILSSKEETIYALESDIPERRAFDVIDALRTPYRYDIKQTVYYVIENYEQLYDLVNQDLIGHVHKARELGEFAPTYPSKDDDGTHRTC